MDWLMDWLIDWFLDLWMDGWMDGLIDLFQSNAQSRNHHENQRQTQDPIHAERADVGTADKGESGQVADRFRIHRWPGTGRGWCHFPLGQNSHCQVRRELIWRSKFLFRIQPFLPPKKSVTQSVTQLSVDDDAKMS